MRAGLLIVIAVVLELGSVSLVLLAAGPAARPAARQEQPEPAAAEPVQKVRQVEPPKPATVPMIADRAYWLKRREKTKA